MLACDLPLVRSGTVARLLEAHAEAPDPAVTAVRREGDPPFEPLCAVYDTSCGPVATDLLRSGIRAAQRLAEETGLVTVDVEPRSCSTSTHRRTQCERRSR